MEGLELMCCFDTSIKSQFPMPDLFWQMPYTINGNGRNELVILEARGLFFPFFHLHFVKESCHVSLIFVLFQILMGENCCGCAFVSDSKIKFLFMGCLCSLSLT